MSKAMVRTQIYLTEEERRALKRVADERNTSQSALVREAVDEYLASERTNWKRAIRGIRGMWKDRDDLPDFQKLRKEWN